MRLLLLIFLLVQCALGDNTYGDELVPPAQGPGPIKEVFCAIGFHRVVGSDGTPQCVPDQTETMPIYQPPPPPASSYGDGEVPSTEPPDERPYPPPPTLSPVPLETPPPNAMPMNPGHPRPPYPPVPVPGPAPVPGPVPVPEPAPVKVPAPYPPVKPSYPPPAPTHGPPPRPLPPVPVPAPLPVPAPAPHPPASYPPSVKPSHPAPMPTPTGAPPSGPATSQQTQVPPAGSGQNPYGDGAEPPRPDGTNLKCPSDEVVDQCGALCEPTCFNREPVCIEICAPPACVCRKGMLRDPNRNKCVTSGECPQVQPPSEEPMQPINYDPCAGKDCPFGTVCQLQKVQCIRAPCPPIPECVPVNLDCAPGEHVNNCGNHCDPRCDDLTPICTLQCGPPACSCDGGYARDPRGKCVPVQNCPGNVPLPNGGYRYFQRVMVRRRARI